MRRRVFASARVRSGAIVLAAMLALGGCGGDDARVVVPPRVDSSLAPATVGTDLKLYESKDRTTVKAFANVGERSLVSDGKLWEIRRADRLIGALQLTTVLPDVDLTDEDTRDTIVNQILPGASNRIRIGDEEVYATTVNDKAVFVWFGRTMYVVLQLKDRQLDGQYDAIAEDVIAHQAASDAWDPLPLVVDTDDDD